MLVSFDNVSFGYQGERLFEDVRFTINEGDRVGLVGGNGEGKTTLVKLLLGELAPEQGIVMRKNGTRIGYLPQTGGYEGAGTVFEEACSVFEEDKKLLAELEEVQKKFELEKEGTESFRAVSAKYETLNKKIAARDSYHYEVRVRAVLNGMGFQNAYHQLVHTMSGGEKTRLKLCKLLLEEPELIVLDEPTNHLDTKTLFWLEEYLSSYKGSIFVVSHDRYFLDKTVREIYDLEYGSLRTYKGNYTKYKALKAEWQAHELKEYENQQEEIAKLKDYIAKNLVRASTTKSAQSRRTKLEKMDLVEKPKAAPSAPVYRFSYSEPSYEKVLTVENLCLKAGEKELVKSLSFELRRGEKCALVGENGTGKSTLLKTILAGENPAVKVGRFVRFAYFDQENARLDSTNTVLRELWDKHPLWDQTKARALLASGGLSAEDVEKRVAQLSGGEKAKLALVIFSAENGNTLLLDEPTNHLDLPARESLETALKAFDGTVLFVSHDRYFVQALAGKILELDKNSCVFFNGSYSDYTAYKKELAEKENAPAPAPIKTGKETQKPCPAPAYRSKEERKNDAKKRVRIGQIEQEISVLEQEESTLNEQLSSPSVSTDFEKLTEVCNRLAQIKERLDLLYGEYEMLLD